MNQNLVEEVAAAKAIFAGTKPLLLAALTQGDPSENEEEKKPKTAKEKYSDKKSKDDEKKASPSIAKK